NVGVPIRISARIPQVPDRYGYYIDVEEYELGDLDEPSNYKVALAYPEFDKWLEAMNTEIKWIFKKKTDMDGNVHTFKARLVVKGYTQTYGVDYGGTFSPVANVMIISVISISSDSSEGSVGTPTGRVILFDTIPTTIPDTTLEEGWTRYLFSDLMQLAVGHHVDHSSSDYFSPDDSSRDSSSDSSSEASSDFHSDASFDSSSGHSLLDHSSLDLPSTSMGPSRKRRRSPTMSVPVLSPVSGDLSPVRADLIPSPKRVKDSGYLTDVEAEIDECIAYADALRDRGIDARVVVEAVDRDETETGVRGLVKVRVERFTHPAMPEDIPEPAQEGSVEVTYETLGDLVQRFHDHTQAILVHRIQAIEGVQREHGHRIIGVESAVTALTERVAELERDNRRLRGTMSVESQRVDRLQRGMSRM
ncbi:reverse transcriptase domain-containing protein, partial [Tanacetum coccineum]